MTHAIDWDPMAQIDYAGQIPTCVPTWDLLGTPHRGWDTCWDLGTGSMLGLVGWVRLSAPGLRSSALWGHVLYEYSPSHVA